MTKTNNFFILLVCLLAGTIADAQQKMECDCAEFGVNKQWADTNGITCYKIPINLLYGDAGKGTKKIAVLRAESTQASVLEPIVYLHGGPGVATLDNAQKYLSHTVWKKLREKHAVIMMDYSGNGYSEPYLCQDLADSIAALEQAGLSRPEIKARTIQYYRDCRDSLKVKNIDINAFTTFQIAADADEIRKQLGIAKWNVYGVSYGTQVAMEYMRKFGAGISNVVLDSPFPPNVKAFSFVSTMQETLQHMQQVINQDPVTAGLFPDIIRDFATAAERLNKQPVKIDSNDFNGDDFAGTMAITFYKTKLVPLIPLALKEFAAGNDQALRQWVKTQYINDGAGGDAYGRLNDFHMNAVNGFEWKPRTKEQTPAYLAAAYPYLAALANADYFEICASFRPESVDPSFYAPVESALRTLVMNCEFDPGCPVSYGYSAIEKLKNASLVIVPNTAHSAVSYNDCTLNLVKEFFDFPEKPVNAGCIKEIQTVKFIISGLEEALEKLTVKKQ